MDYIKFLKTEKRVLTSEELRYLDKRIKELDDIDLNQCSDDLQHIIFTENDLIQIVIIKSMERLEKQGVK